MLPVAVATGNADREHALVDPLARAQVVALMFQGSQLLLEQFVGALEFLMPQQQAQLQQVRLHSLTRRILTQEPPAPQQLSSRPP